MDIPGFDTNMQVFDKLSKSWIIMGTIFATLIPICLTRETLSKADKIISLPGQPPVNFQQFSGYITVDEKQQRALFYYFVEADTNPASKPLVLWLSGGPGCSSVGAGAFREHGPFRPSREALVKNEYSWNKEANMLYLESPAGVGFSYSANKSFYNFINDEMTARDSLMFLQRWFLKFPEYKNRDLFLTGESYAGHYVPQLAHLIIQSNVKFKLKGIAVGNPLLEFSTDFNSVDVFYWSHGLISDSTYQLLTSTCNSSQLMRETIEGSVSPACFNAYGQLSNEIGNSIDKYDVISDVCLSSIYSQLEILNHPAWSRFRFESEAFKKAQVAEKIDVCIGGVTMEYLNRRDVQKALHAKLVGITNWTICSDQDVLNYDMQELFVPTIQVIGSLVRSGIRVLVYSGDQDSVIPIIGTRTLINGLAKELGLKTTVPYRAWFEGKQVGGWTQVYGDILSFASIRGASHTAPFTQPERSLVLFTAFLEGKPLPEEEVPTHQIHG